VLRLPAVAGLLGLTFAFFALYGPVDVALPVHVAIELGAPATLLATYVSVFSAGALLGGLAAGWLERLPLWPLTTGIVVTWGCCLLPLGLGAPQPVALAAFGLGAFAYAPYMAATTSLVQGVTPLPLLPRVLALRSAILNIAVPLGAVAAGPLVVTVGARRTILVSALATIALGGATALAARLGKRRKREPDGSSPRPGDARSLAVGHDVAARSDP
jgi:predicted MFS family arabinose efflux permease